MYYLIDLKICILHTSTTAIAVAEKSQLNLYSLKTQFITVAEGPVIAGGE